MSSRIFAATVIGGAILLAMPALDAQRKGNVDWPLHNLDLAGSRFSTLDQINALEREVADAALAVPARRHRRRQQPDDADHRRRHDVRHRFARQRLRRQRRRRASAVVVRRHQPDWRRRARRLRLPQPRRRSTPTASSTPPPARSCSRSTRRPASRFRRFGNNGQASVILDVLKTALSRTSRPPSAWATGSRRRRRSQRRALHRQHAQREPHPRRPRAGGRREDRQGALALQHDSAGREGPGLGDRRADLGRRRAQRRRHLGDAGRSIPSWACSTSRSGNPFGDSTKRAGHESLHRLDHRARRSAPAS